MFFFINEFLQSFQIITMFIVSHRNPPKPPKKAKEMQTPVEFLKEQYDYCPRYEEQIHDEDWDKAKEMEAKQNEKYNELKEVIENMIKHLDEGIQLTLRKDSIIVEALRNSINQ